MYWLMLYTQISLLLVFSPFFCLVESSVIKAKGSNSKISEIIITLLIQKNHNVAYDRKI